MPNAVCVANEAKIILEFFAFNGSNVTNVKKTEQLGVRVTPEMCQRIARVEKRCGVKATEMCRLGLVEVLNRLESGMPAVLSASPAELRAIAECHALHVDPVEAMRVAVRAKVTAT